MADPFEWGVEEVIEFLCDPQKRLIEGPEAFAAKLREGEFDGEQLLSFGIILDDRQLQEHLGLSKPRQQMKVAAAIRQLRQRSQGFKAWHVNFMADGLPVENGHSQLREANTNVYTKVPASDSATTEKLAENHNKEAPERTNPDESLPAGEATVTDVSARIVRRSSETVVDPKSSSNVSKRAESPAEHAAPKRRRLAPVNLSSEPVQAAPVPVRAELEYLKTSLEVVATSTAEILESSPRNWYLGQGSIRRDDIRSTSTSLSTRLIHHSDRSFAVQLPSHQPPGRRIAVWRETRRLFMETTKAVNMILQGQTPPSRSGSLGLDDLPDPDIWDEETERAVQAEAREKEAEQRRNKQLTSDEVIRLMDAASDNIRANWEDRKAPNHELRAFRVWNQASRGGGRYFKMEKANSRIADLERRLLKYRKEILREGWTRAEDVTRQTRILEASIEDICEQTWRQKILALRHPPPRPPRRTARRSALKALEKPPDGEEVLMSSGDEGSFIVDDGEDDEDEEMMGVEQQLQTEAEAAADRPKQEDREASIVDLTQHFTPKKSEAFIDLTSPRAAEPDADVAMGPNNDHDESLITPQMVQEAQGSDPKRFAKASRARMLVSCLWKLNHDMRVKIFAAADQAKSSTVWQETIEPYIARASNLSEAEDVQASSGELQPEELQTSFEMTLLFYTFLTIRRQHPKKLAVKVRKRLSGGWATIGTESLFKAFIHLLQQAAPLYPKASQIYRREALLDDDSQTDGDFGDDAGNDATPSRRRRRAAVEVVQNKDALDLREREAARAQDLAQRRQQLRQKLAVSNPAAPGRTQHIINESKQEHQGLIFVNSDIGNRIKEHQVDGVRFLWNQIVRDPAERQGCLLAHTMGLGKTMQVITFLVALHEAANADDPTVREQVPRDLRDNPTLITCPAGLVDNWMDELLIWTPPGALDPLQKIDATMPHDERVSAIETWSSTGGILVMGHEMLKGLYKLNGIKNLLLETPKTVVVDEAHRLKNPKTAINMICSEFKTGSRIALTGSPLANDVEEYYHMIDWVAPNFLGPINEFKEVYSKDIGAGLYNDSGPAQKRQAIVKLQALKETVAPKMHRATITALKHDLPNKHEFVISLKPTDAQRDLYDACMEIVLNAPNEATRQNKILQVVDIFRRICNHPKCLWTKVKHIKETAKDETGVMSSALITKVLKMAKRLDIDDFRLSPKIILLLKILDDARAANEKVLVFSTSIPTLDYLEHVLLQEKRQVSRLDGNTTISKRQRMVKEFNAGEKEVYLISTRAGGVGLNIQGASRVVIFDFGWNPMDEQQAIGRAYRIGQKKTVFVYHLVLAGTFEEDIHNKAVFKTQLASRVVDKKNPISWSKRGGKVLHNVKSTKAKDLTHFIGKDTILDSLIGRHKDVVTSIVSTDTFEEEDHTSTLTADELKAAEEIVRKNYLRRTDPEAYEREMDRQRAEAAIPSRQHNFSIPNQLLPTLPERSVAAVEMNSPLLSTTVDASADPPTVSLAHSMDGVSEYPYIRSRTTNGVFGMSNTRGQPKLQYHSMAQAGEGLPAPQPIAGTNTYFGTPPATAPAHLPPPQRPVQGPFQTNLSQAREEFEKEFRRQIYDMQKEWGPLPANTVISIVSEVNELRRAKGLGFLPDDAQWRNLKSYLNSPRFTAAAALKRLTANWLAFAEPEDMQARTRVLEEMTEDEFVRFLEIKGRAADPTNIENIRRSPHAKQGESRSSHANEDMKAMREAADKRQRSSAQLPQWAHNALWATQP